MGELVTPAKVVNFCTIIIKEYCITTNGSVVISSNDTNPDMYLLQGGTLNQAIGVHNQKIPIVLLKRNGFWLHFSLAFTRKNKFQACSHRFNGISLQIFKENGNETALLFRAEWDNKERNKFEHPQPHWHFHPQIEYLINGRNFDSSSFDTYLSLIDEPSGFEEELLTSDHPKPNNISSFHFAMLSQWQEKKPADIPLTEGNLINWLSGVMKSIDLQLEYCFD